MDYSFTEEQNMLRDTIRRFIETEVPRDLARDIDEKMNFTRTAG
jgi:hypothetical protein